MAIGAHSWLNLRRLKTTTESPKVLRQPCDPKIARQLTNQGADLLVCLANGMSFDSESALRQHFNISRFRAIENNRYFIRCGSTGVSCLISPTGQIVSVLPCESEGTLNLKIPTGKRDRTVYSSIGDALSITSGIALACFPLFALWRPRSRNSTQLQVASEKKPAAERTSNT